MVQALALILALYFVDQESHLLVKQDELYPSTHLTLRTCLHTQLGAYDARLGIHLQDVVRTLHCQSPLALTFVPRRFLINWRNLS